MATLGITRTLEVGLHADILLTRVEGSRLDVVELLRGGGVAPPPMLPKEVMRSNLGEDIAPPTSLGVEGVEKVSESSRIGGGMTLPPNPPPLCDPVEEDLLRVISSKLILLVAMLGEEFAPRTFRRGIPGLGWPPGAESA